MSDSKEIPQTPGLLSLPNIQGLLLGGCPAGSSLAVQNGKPTPNTSPLNVIFLPGVSR